MQTRKWFYRSCVHPVPTLDYSDWELLIFAPDSSCMQLANSNRVATCHVVFSILAIFAVFFTIIVMGEKRRQQVMEEREKEL